MLVKMKSGLHSIGGLKSHNKQVIRNIVHYTLRYRSKVLHNGFSLDVFVMKIVLIQCELTYIKQRIVQIGIRL